jgi:hypothetical protein
VPSNALLTLAIWCNGQSTIFQAGEKDNKNLVGKFSSDISLLRSTAKIKRRATNFQERIKYVWLWLKPEIKAHLHLLGLYISEIKSPVQPKFTK